MTYGMKMISQLPTKAIVEGYNIAADSLGEKNVKRFANRDKAIARTAEIANRVTNPQTIGELDTHFNAESLEVAPAPAPAPKAPTTEATGVINRNGNIVLKANKEVRADLTAAAKRLGGSRYRAEGFADSADFLNGFAHRPTMASGRMVIQMEAIKGKEVVGRFEFEINAEGAAFVR